MLFLGAMEDRMAQELLAQLEAGSAIFTDVLSFIEARYTYTPTAFKNGQQRNAANENQGSAKVCFFCATQWLRSGANPQPICRTLCFKYLQHLMELIIKISASLCSTGWDGVQFETHSPQRQIIFSILVLNLDRKAVRY